MRHYEAWENPQEDDSLGLWNLLNFSGGELNWNGGHLRRETISRLEGYDVVKPLKVILRLENDAEWIGSLAGASCVAFSGPTVEECLHHLAIAIADSYERYKSLSDEKLSEPLRQAKKILMESIKETSS